MSGTTTRLTPEAYHEFVAAVGRLSSETRQLRSYVAGWLYAGLLLAAQGAEEVTDSGGSAYSGP